MNCGNRKGKAVMKDRTGDQFLKLTKYKNLSVFDPYSGIEPPTIIETKDPKKAFIICLAAAVKR